MKVRVRLFAAAREIADRGTVELELPEQARLADLRRALVVVVPELSKLMPQLMFAVGTNYADDSTPLAGGAEVACIPPVSGG